CQEHAAAERRDGTFRLDHAAGAALRLHDVGIEASERGAIGTPAGVIGRAAPAAAKAPAIAAGLGLERLDRIEGVARTVARAVDTRRRRGLGAGRNCLSSRNP